MERFLHKYTDALAGTLIFCFDSTLLLNLNSSEIVVPSKLADLRLTLEFIFPGGILTVLYPLIQVSQFSLGWLTVGLCSETALVYLFDRFF